MLFAHSYGEQIVTRDLAGACKFCEIDIANCFLKGRQTLEINIKVGVFQILMTRSVKKTSSEIRRVMMFI